MINEESWVTSVRYLVLNFREALAELTPYMDRVRIGWRDVEAYDDWDEIAQSLYKNMVLRSIQFFLEEGEGLTIPDYGTVYTTYEGKSFIELEDSALQKEERLVFIGFSTVEHSFDQVRCQLVSEPDLRAIGAPACLRVPDANFIFIVNEGKGIRKRISDIQVQI